MAKCTHSGPRGMCPFDAVPGLDKCRKHGNIAEIIMAYRFTDPDLKERMDFHSRDELIESVKQEVVLVRALIEERRNFATNQSEKIQAFPQIIDATAKLERLVTSLARLEKQSGQVLEKAALHKLGRRLVEILTDALKDIPDRDTIVDRVAKEIAAAVMAAKNETLTDE